MIIPLPAPLQDEILSSWIIRSALSHGTDPMGWSYGLWQDWRGWTRDIDREMPREILGKIARAGEMSIERIRSMTLKPLLIPLLGEASLHPTTGWDWVIPLGVRNRSRTNGLHFCPTCLSEPHPYAPKQWRLSWNTICPKHGTQLVLSCPECGQVFSPHLIDYRRPHFYRCTRCGYDLRKADASAGNPQVLALQSYMNALAFNTPVPPSSYRLPVRRDDPKEFFALVSDLHRFFINFHKRKDRFSDVMETLDSPKEWEDFRRLPGEGFDRQPLEQRHYWLLIISYVLTLDAEQFTATLLREGVTQNTMQIGNFPRSLTMKRVKKALPYKEVRRKKGGGSVKFHILSTEEVEERMDAIRKFL